MIITCQECNSSFNVDDGLIKETGTKVRCSKCENIFVAYPHSPEDDLLLDPDEQLPSSDESPQMDDIDATLDGFFSADELFQPETAQKKTDDELEAGVGLDNLENKLDMELEPEIEDMLEDTIGGLNLDLGPDDSAGPDKAEAPMIGDELPDLEDLSAFDEESLSVDSEDLNLDLQLDSDAETAQDDEISAADIAVEETDELDLSDLDLESDDTPAAETASGDDSEDLDLDLQLDPDTENTEDDEISAADITVEETATLDLSDLDLESDNAPAAKTATGDDPEDLDLDLQFDMDAENAEDDEISAADIEVEETATLDLSDLDLESDNAPAAETASGDDSEDFDLALDLESETIAGNAESTSDELDLSDLEEIIDSDPGEPADTAPEALELDLENNDDQKTQAADTTAAAEDDDQLDFSDLESMLQSGEPTGPIAKVDDADEPDLQFDIDEPVADVVDTPASGDEGDAAQVDSLLDIEKMLEKNEDTADEDLDAPLEMDTALEDVSEEEDELELDFDLESELQEKEDLLNGSATADEQLESNLLTSDDTDTSDEADLEGVDFDAEEFKGGPVTTDEFATDELLEKSDAPHVTDDTPSAPAAMMPKSRSKKPVLVVLLLLFLAGGILIVPNMLGIKIPYISDIKIPYLSDLDIRIPYLSDKLNPKEKDVAGNLKIIPLGGTINARFVSDTQGNQRFVIHGKIKNGYDHPRSFIKITGKIYQRGGKLAKTETVYCGNVLSDSELTGMNILAINKRLHNRFGDKKSNLKVKTGKSIPFMIVFDKLPQNLDEYTVEVDGSSI